ncbi:hypothetical protein [Streptomyces sp. NBC_00724]|uniref:hypothetical protein n=1 Tax=Streptomyces sp. NBC_00724 TaxID=2975812 RepID=UPI002ED20B89|nr:hypothetical protein OHB17_42050 [Streptomyces sp. NBC_00724]
MQHGTNNPDYSVVGEPCASVGDLQPGHQISALGGAAFLSVLDVSHDPDAGATSLHIDAAPSGPGPFLLPTGSMVNVRRPEPEQADHTGEDDEEATVTVSLTVTEQVTYEFETEVQIPAGVAGDADALHEYLADNEDLWLDSLDPSGASGYLSVNERSLDTAEVVLAA